MQVQACAIMSIVVVVVCVVGILNVSGPHKFSGRKNKYF